MSRRGWVLFIAMGVIWGIPYLLIKVAVGDLHPATLVLFRTAIGALILVPLAASQGGLRPLLPYWRWVLLFAVIEVTLPWILLSDAERRLSSSLTGLLLAAVPSVGAVLAWASGGDDRLDLRRVGGLLVGFVGVGVLVGLDVSFRDLGAVGEVGLVAIGYALGPMIVSRKLAGVPAVAVIAASLLLSAVAYAPFGLAGLPHVVPRLPVLASVAILGLVCTALAFLLFFALIAEVGPTRAMVITYINPAVALFLGVLVLGEPFTVGAAAGLVLIVAGSILATRRAARPRERGGAEASEADPHPTASLRQSGR